MPMATPAAANKAAKVVGLDTEVAQNADHQHDVEGDIDDGTQITHDGGVHMLASQCFLHQVAHHADQPAAQYPEHDGSQQFAPTSMA